MTHTNLVEIESLCVKRGSFTLQLEKWAVPPGEVIGLVGPNGAGKTTLLEALGGLRPTDAGSISVFGLDPWKDPVAVRSALGFMSDEMAVFDMRIGALLRMLSGYYPTWDGGLVEDLLRRLEVDPHQKTSELSRGQGTRLRLIMALAFRPRLLLLDEPAAGLDLSGRRAFLEIVLDVVKDDERSVIVSSHALHDVERIADRLLVLDHGRMVHEGATADLVGEDRTLEDALLEWGAA